ncbi:hypothetical protein WJX84_004730 [Apatococcus fuscideae]|uniref:Uncharacterized protein n=1 Tax=Apatococcus fuscideae TaxID=2026836 RepID=A0AAW1TDA1_9CHLO
MGDCGICCCGLWCLPCLYGDNNTELRGSGLGPGCLYFWLSCCVCFFAGPFRAELRERHNLQERPCSDCCVHCCCSPCAVCQEAREIKYHRAHGPPGAYLQQQAGPMLPQYQQHSGAPQWPPATMQYPGPMQYPPAQQYAPARY